MDKILSQFKNYHLLVIWRIGHNVASKSIVIDGQNSFLLTPGSMLQKMAASSIKLKIHTKNDFEEVDKGHSFHFKKNKGEI